MMASGSGNLGREWRIVGVTDRAGRRQGAVQEVFLQSFIDALRGVAV